MGCGCSDRNENQVHNKSIIRLQKANQNISPNQQRIDAQKAVRQISNDQDILIQTDQQNKDNPNDRLDTHFSRLKTFETRQPHTGQEQLVTLKEDNQSEENFDKDRTNDGQQKKDKREKNQITTKGIKKINQFANSMPISNNQLQLELSLIPQNYTKRKSLPLQIFNDEDMEK